MTAIHLVTELPGPRSRALLARSGAACARAKTPTFPVYVERAHGATVHDVDGNDLVDFTGGIGCLNIGHAHPRVVRAVQETSARFMHTDYAITPYPEYVELAERLLARVDLGEPGKAILFNSGAEAVENAVKIARRATGRPAVIAFEGAFHGRTLMAMSMTSKPHPYKAGFGPYAPEVYRVAYPDASRYGGEPEATAAALADLVRCFETRVAPEQVACVVIEPELGEGGFVPAAAGYLPALRELCDRHGIVLVVDEVQSGFGRCGTFFAYEADGVRPDLVVAAKSLAAGLPLSAVIGRARIVDACPEGTLGGTYVGNPVACAAALAVLDAFDEDDVLGAARRLGATLRERLEVLAAAHPGRIAEVRGRGAMLGVVLVDAEGRPDGALAQRVVDEALHRGLLLLRCGLAGNVLRMLMPLTIADEELADGLAALDDAVAASLRPAVVA